MRDYQSKTLKTFKNGVFSGYRTAINVAVADAINDRDGAFRCLDAVLDILLDTYVRMEVESTAADRAQWRETYIEAYTQFENSLNVPNAKLGGETPLRYIVGHLCHGTEGIEARAEIISKATIARRKYEALREETVKEFDTVATMRHFAV